MVTKQVYSLLLIAGLLIGCSSAPTIIEKPVYYEVIVHDTVQLVGDTVWYGGITNPEGDAVGSIAVRPKNKTAVVDIKETIYDTVYYEVPTTSIAVYEKVVTSLFSVIPVWQKLIIMILLIAGFFIYLKLWGR